jgi:hypothetical protein
METAQTPFANADANANASANDGAQAPELDRTHESRFQHDFSPCTHTCPGSDCKMVHKCDIPNCSMKGEMKNEWKKQGSGLLNHIGAPTKHSKCSPNCPAYDQMQKKIQRKEELKMERKREREQQKGKVEPEVDSGDEEIRKGGGALRKRARVVYSEDEDDANEPAPAPSASASELGAPMSVDVADPNRADVSATAGNQDLHFKIVVVLNVNGRSNHRDITKSTAWLKTEMKAKVVDGMLSDEALTNFIQRVDPEVDDEANPQEGSTMVWIYDRVSANITLSAADRSDQVCTALARPSAREPQAFRGRIPLMGASPRWPPWRRKLRCTTSKGLQPLIRWTTCFSRHKVSI